MRGNACSIHTANQKELFDKSGNYLKVTLRHKNDVHQLKLKCDEIEQQREVCLKNYLLSKRRINEDISRIQAKTPRFQQRRDSQHSSADGRVIETHSVRNSDDSFTTEVVYPMFMGKPLPYPVRIPQPDLQKSRYKIRTKHESISTALNPSVFAETNRFMQGSAKVQRRLSNLKHYNHRSENVDDFKMRNRINSGKIEMQRHKSDPHLNFERAGNKLLQRRRHSNPVILDL